MLQFGDVHNIWGTWGIWGTTTILRLEPTSPRASRDTFLPLPSDHLEKFGTINTARVCVVLRYVCMSEEIRSGIV